MGHRARKAEGEMNMKSKRTSTTYVRPFALHFTEEITPEEMEASDPANALKEYEKSDLKKIHDASFGLLNSGHSKLGGIAFGAIEAEQELTNTLERIDEILLQEIQVGNPKTAQDLTPRQMAVTMIDGPFQMLCADAERKEFDGISVSTALGLGAALMRLAIENPGTELSAKLDELLKRSGAMAADVRETKSLAAVAASNSIPQSIPESKEAAQKELNALVLAIPNWPESPQVETIRERIAELRFYSGYGTTPEEAEERHAWQIRNDEWGEQEEEQYQATLRLMRAKIRLAEREKISAVSGEIEKLRDDVTKAMEETRRLHSSGAAETQRMLHRIGRKVEGVPPALDKLALAGKDMAAATQQFRHTVKMDDGDWEIYNRMELRNHNQSWVARDLGMKPYQVSRAWARIKAAWEDAGYPIAEKVTMGNAVLGEDGVVFKKPTKRRKRRS